jgi:hypothetical protein
MLHLYQFFNLIYPFLALQSSIISAIPVYDVVSTVGGYPYSTEYNIAPSTYVLLKVFKKPF